jgi:hemin uptake protein HemP
VNTTPLPAPTDDDRSSPRAAARAPLAGAEPRITSRQLLGDGKEVLIEHRGAIYRLRETSLGKLILTK